MGWAVDYSFLASDLLLILAYMFDHFFVAQPSIFELWTDPVELPKSRLGQTEPHFGPGSIVEPISSFTQPFWNVIQFLREDFYIWENFREP